MWTPLTGDELEVAFAEWLEDEGRMYENPEWTHGATGVNFHLETLRYGNGSFSRGLRFRFLARLSELEGSPATTLLATRLLAEGFASTKWGALMDAGEALRWDARMYEMDKEIDQNSDVEGRVDETVREKVDQAKTEILQYVRIELENVHRQTVEEVLR